MGEEKREHDRFPVHDLQGTLLYASEVDVVNLSLGGAAIETGKRLDIGGEYLLKLRLAEGALSLRGLVVWSVISRNRPGGKGESVPVYSAGIRFTEVFSDKARELMEFLESREFTRGKRLNGLRFPIEPRQPAVLDYPFNYRVRNISAGGMEIETRQGFEADKVFQMDISLAAGVLISLYGRVAFCREASPEGGRGYHVGIQFQEMTEEHRARLDEYVKGL